MGQTSGQPMLATTKAGPLDELAAIELQNSIWKAALEPGGWRGAVTALAHSFGASSAKAAVLDLATGQADMLATHEIDPEIALRWQRGEGGRDLWAESGLREFRQGRRSATGSQLVPLDEYRRSEIYHEVSGPCGHEDCLTTAVAVDGRRLGFVSLYRRDLFTMSELESFERIAAQLRSAISLQAQVVRRATAAASLESVAAPALVCDGQGRIESANAAAERLLREGDGMYSVAGRVHARFPGSERRLQRAMAEAAETARGQRAGGAGMLAVRRDGRPPLGALAVPAPGNRSVPILAQLSCGPAVLLVLSDPELRPELPSAALERVFGLTPAEADMARALARGKSVTEYADAHRLSIETARTRVKAVLQKTGVHRQADLVRLVLTSVASRVGSGGDEG